MMSYIRKWSQFMGNRGNDTQEHQMQRPVDPVCGIRLNPRYVEFVTHMGGKAFYFCSLKCKMAFDHAPYEYIEPDRENTTI